MADIEDAIVVLTAASLSPNGNGPHMCAEAVDDYIAAVGGNVSSRYDALQALRAEVVKVILDKREADWIVSAIDTRLAEVTASMAGTGLASVPSDLRFEPASQLPR